MTARSAGDGGERSTEKAREAAPPRRRDRGYCRGSDVRA